MSDDRAGNVTRSKEPFVKFPLWLLKPGVSTPNEKAVILALASHGGEIFPSHQRLADEAGCSKSTLKRTLIELRKKGWLSWVERFHENTQISNVYSLHLGDLEWNPPCAGAAHPDVQELHTPQVTENPTQGHSDLPPRSHRPTEQDSINKIQLKRKQPGASAAEAASASPEKGKNYEPDLALVPKPLLSIQQEVADTWTQHLGGKRTEASFKRYLKELMKIHAHPQGGIEAIKKQLEKAELNAVVGRKKWASITYDKFLELGLASRGKPPVQEKRHNPGNVPLDPSKFMTPNIQK